MLFFQFISSNEKNTSTLPMKHNLIDSSIKANIRLVEIYCPNNGEVTWFKEFPRKGKDGGDEEYSSVSLDLKEMMLKRNYDVLRMMTWDDEGNSKSFQISRKLLRFIQYYV